MRRQFCFLGPLLLLALWTGCDAESAVDPPSEHIAAVPAGGGLVTGPAGTPLAGVEVEVPAAAAPGGAAVTLRAVDDDTPLPERARAVGSAVRVELDPPPQAPIRITLPVNTAARAGHGQDYTQVKVWMRNPMGWELIEPAATTPGTVTVEVQTLDTVLPGVRLED